MNPSALLVLGWLSLAQPVQAIDVRGNRKVSEDTIRFYARELGHGPLADRLVEKIFNRLWATGLFEDIRFHRVPNRSGGSHLLIEVKEKRWLRQVQLQGGRVFRTEAELNRMLAEAGCEVRRHHPLGEDDARCAAAALKRRMGSAYEVKAELRAAGPDFADLILTLQKRRSLPIRSIHFQGNEALHEAQLLASLQWRPSSFFTHLAGRDRFDRNELEVELERLRELYRSRGFLDAVVGPARVETSARGVSLTIPIEEGPVYSTGDIHIDPGFFLDEPTVRSWLSLSPGAPYDATRVRRVQRRIERRYRENGYGAVRVEIDETRKVSAHRVDLILRVDSGRLHLFGRIELKGNERTPDPHLRQYLDATDRARFDPAAIEADERRLRSLGLVDQVQAQMATGGEPNIVNVTYRVKELPRFELFAGGGANGIEGASGALHLTARDLFRHGETWGLDGQLGNRLGDVSVAYRDPVSLGHRWIWTAAFSRRRVDYPEGTTDTLESFSWEVFGGSRSRLAFRGGLAWSRFRLASRLEAPVDFLTPFLGRHFDTRRLHLDIGHDGREPPIFPSSGAQVLGRIELAGGPFGGDVSLVKTRGSLQWVIPLREASGRHLLALRGRVELLWPFGATRKEGLPRFERLFLGGEEDLRGFAVRRVGPRSPDTVPLGGDRAWLASLEYQYAFHPRVRLVGFLDFGNVYASDVSGPREPLVRYDTGGELRFVAPFLSLPLRLGYGLNLNRQPGEPRGRFFVAFSTRF